MGVLLRYTDFRFLCSQRLTFVDTLAIAGPPFNSIQRVFGQFTGVLPGMSVQLIGTAHNDGRYLVASKPSPETLLIDTSDGSALTDETVGATAIVVQIAKDGSEEFPGLSAGQAGRTSLVRAGGFTGGFQGLGSGGAVPFYDGTPLSISVNAFAADPGPPQFDWYLSQRTDDPAKQYLAIHQAHDNVDGTTNSGTVQLGHTALATAELAISGIPSVDQVMQLFRFCDLYCRRRSDGAIQWTNPLRAMFQA